MNRLLLSILFTVCLYSDIFAAVGCSLNDPDRDVKRIFPDSSGYRTTFLTINEMGREPLKQEIENKLGDKFDNIYEDADVPYACYTVLKGKEVIGYVHGVNQKGKYGGLQLILATDLRGRIIEFYYQKISSTEARKFRDQEFTGQFKGLTLEDFYGYDVLGDKQGSGRVAGIKDPSSNSHEDFKATLRGIKKNLIIFDELFFRAEKEGAK